MNLKKVKSDSVVQQIIDSLVDAMIRRELKPGDKIPPEMELAESLGVGRNSVREAIKILTYLGVLQIRRAEGTFVCKGFSESMIDPMVYGIILDSSDSYDDLMELREITEVGIMQLAMRHVGDSELQELYALLEDMKTEVKKGPGNIDGIFEADNRFHEKISEMGHNPLTQKIDAVVRTLTHALRYQSVVDLMKRGESKEFIAAHEKLYQILKEKRSENLNLSVRNTYFRPE